MHAATLSLVLFAATFAASLSRAEVPTGCSCEDQRECTAVNDIPIVYAARDMVRKKYLDLGARLVKHDSWTDDFAAPKGVPYTHVLAFYAQGRRMSKLRFTYPKKDFDGIVKDFAKFGAIAEQVTETGAGKRWRMGDGAEIGVWRDDDGAFVEFTSLAMDAQFSAELRPGYRSPLETNAPTPRVQDSAAPPLSITTSNPRQGLFEFHSDGALLLGKHDLRENMCGMRDDFDWTTLLRDRESGLVDNKDKSLHFSIDSDGHVNLKLALSDEFGPDIYRFLDVRPGVPTSASVDGDCRRRKVSVTYTKTHAPLCLTVDALNQPSYQVVQKLVEVTGIRVDGAELVPREKDRVTFNNLELDAATLLRLLGDVTDLELVEKAPEQFEFRKPVKPAH